MSDRQEEILKEVMEACADILAVMEKHTAPANGSALLICLVVLAHEEQRLKDELLQYLVGRVDKSWHLFTRERVEQQIAKWRKRQAH